MGLTPVSALPVSLAAALLLMAVLVTYPRVVPCVLIGAAWASVLTIAAAQADSRRDGYERLEPGSVEMPRQYTDWEIARFRKHGYLHPTREPSEDELLAAEQVWAADAAKHPHHTYNIAT